MKRMLINATQEEELRVALALMGSVFMTLDIEAQATNKKSQYL